jgi:hypothetical protein
MRRENLRGEKDEKIKSYNEWLVVYRDRKKWNGLQNKIQFDLWTSIQYSIKLILS